MSPTQRALAELRRLGAVAAIVERSCCWPFVSSGLIGGIIGYILRGIYP